MSGIYEGLNYEDLLLEARQTVFGSATPAPEAPKQGLFPRALSLLNEYLPLPTNARTYIESVIDKKKDRITNANFTAEELDIIRDLVEASTRAHTKEPGTKWERTFGPTPGSVNYDTYRKGLATEPKLFGLPWSEGGNVGLDAMLERKGRVATTLGQFTYDLDPETGDVVVRDRYNFNAYGPGGMKSTGTHFNELSPTMKKVVSVASLGYFPLRHYGQEQLPEGSGRDVEIRIPKERFGEFYQTVVDSLRNKKRGLMPSQ